MAHRIAGVVTQSLDLVHHVGRIVMRDRRIHAGLTTTTVSLMIILKSDYFDSNERE